MLLAVLVYEGLGALAGGSLLVNAPDGRWMKMPVAILHGAFADFRVPGLILFALGALNLAAFVAVLRRSRWDWVLACLAIGGMMVWFFVEIVILRELHWLHAMWGLPVLLATIGALSLLPVAPETLRDAALIGGIASSALYAAMNVFVPSGWPGYSSASQTVSELSAIGAPTRPLWVVLAVVYTLLVTGFGWGVRQAAGDDRRLRIAGSLIAVYGALGIAWIFAPMHLRPVLAAGGGTARDQVHIALGAVTEVLYLLALGFAAAALGRAFRAYSFATVAALVGFGVLVFRQAPAVGRDGPTPFIGVWERINIGVFLGWMIVLAVALLRRGRAPIETSARPSPVSATWRPRRPGPPAPESSPRTAV